ncbi:MAG: TylF/MycF/NovP-related O-methyltransferase [Rhodospirillales bacterium]|nr:TylF/MycF/NovP-related O-methyltransferase [Rhodospirillales bacterium]MDP6772652.1 TylF/MycF/NovP-related O-methyltransferase [Rhodospirillales bacterium]
MGKWNIGIGAAVTGLRRLSREPRKGRNVMEGYIRGCGLQFGNVKELCQSDPVFQRAMGLAERRTIVTSYKLMNLFMIIAFGLIKVERGHIFEFGSYKGGSAIFMAAVAQEYLPDTNVFALDTFSGMPETDEAIDTVVPGDFDDVDADELIAYAATAGLSNLTFVPGRFEETAPALLADAGSAALVHIDCDTYPAVSYAYESCKPYMVPGGYIVLDDPQVASCLGAMEAVEEHMIRADGLHAEQAFPHLVFRYPPLD